MEFYQCKSCGFVDSFVGDDPAHGNIVMLNPAVCDKCWSFDQLEESAHA